MRASSQSFPWTKRSRRREGHADQAVRNGLTFTFAHNPSLIGGMRIKVGSDVYDGSIQTRLAQLEEV